MENDIHLKRINHCLAKASCKGAGNEAFVDGDVPGRISTQHPLGLLVCHELEGGLGRYLEDVDAVPPPQAPDSTFGQHVPQTAHQFGLLCSVNLRNQKQKVVVKEMQRFWHACRDLAASMLRSQCLKSNHEGVFLMWLDERFILATPAGCEGSFRKSTYCLKPVL
jgi:hypothetical protein